MTIFKKVFNNYPWIKEILWQAAVPLILFLLVFLFFPSRQRFQFDDDEGYELMKASLVDSGFNLYGDVWDDQTPLLTYFFAPGIHFFGNKVSVARYQVLFFSCILIWAAFQYLRLSLGNRYAIAGAILIIMLPFYLQLSVSAMQAIPNLAFAMLSLLALTKWHKTHHTIWLVLSSLALGISILIKLFTGFLAPVFAIGILIGEYAALKNKKEWYKSLFPCILWGVILMIILVVAGIGLIGLENLDQVLGTHLATIGFSNRNANWTIANQIKVSLPFLLLGWISAISLLIKKKWWALYPLAWMMVAYLMLSFNYPVWYHQQLLVTVPTALLGAYAAVEGFELLKTALKILQPHFPLTSHTILRIVSFLGILLIFMRFPEGFQVLNPLPSLSGSGLGLGIKDAETLSLMSNYAPQTNWVVTDSPMFAFRCRLPVPPNLAVISAKRIFAGLISEEEIIDTIRQYKPKQVLFTKHIFPSVDQYLLENGYRIIHSYQDTRLYFHNDLVVH
jgi:4-amino-4-deoxy-L-arabinose transferase-like glycosyltransferase